MKAWITKYALSSGIMETDAEVCGVGDGRMIRVLKKEGEYADNYFHKPHWHEKREEAVTHAESMRVKKVVSLKNSIAKIEKLKF